MNKKLKIEVIAGSFAALLVWDIILLVNGTRGQKINIWWAGGLAILTILYGLFGLVTAKHWSWLKSKVGQSVFFISLGTIMWGIGQAGWTYYAFKFPNQEYQPARILDILFFSSIPLWFYGVLKLTKATGAKYGLKKIRSRLLVLALGLGMVTLSYYFLVIVARGGKDYFQQPLWDQFFNLGYSIGDAIILTTAFSIFILSWKYLGGRFKNPIIVTLFSFGILYVADFLFNFRSLKNIYYNGDISDILFLIALAVLSVALCLLDPSTPTLKAIEEKIIPTPSVSPKTDNIAEPQNSETAVLSSSATSEYSNDLSQEENR